MFIKYALLWATKQLKKINNASLDAEILLSFAIKKPKEFLYTHPEYNLKIAEENKFKKFAQRRKRHEPVTYITGQKEFFGLPFFVNKNVLIPRPETEILVEEVIKQQTTNHKRLTTIIDIGTGSGCIAVALAKNLPNAKIFATDISKKSLSVAHKNARQNKVDITFLSGDLLAPLLKKIKRLPAPLIITANLPYLTPRQWQTAQPEIKKCEPKSALIGGKDGLEYYIILLNQLRACLTEVPSGSGRRRVTRYALRVTLYLEIDPSQNKPLTKIITQLFPSAKIEIKKDLAGLNRVVIVNF